MLNEDIKPGYAPKEITFMGYTTKNLHHSADAAKAFQDTIAKAHSGSIRDHQLVKDALMHTDQYMKLNDMHLEQGKAPEPAEVKSWIHMHERARRDLEQLGEFPHHLDYWHNHLHELELMQANYTPETAGVEMADSYTPEGNMVQEELSKTIKPSDRVKVARVIADMLGVDNAESLSPDTAVNQGLRKIKNKRMTPEFVGTIKKMVTLAKEVGIKVDETLLPKAVSEEVVNSIVQQILSESRLGDFLPPFRANGLWVNDHRGNSVVQVNGHGSLAKEIADALNQYVNKKNVKEETISEDKVNKDSTYNAAKDRLRFNDFAKLAKLNKGIVPTGNQTPLSSNTSVFGEEDDKVAPEEDETDTVANVPTQVGHSMTHPTNDQLRRRKVQYKLGEWIEEEIQTKAQKYLGAPKGKDYEVKIDFTTHDGERGSHTHTIKNASSAKHAKRIAMNRHDEKFGSKHKSFGTSSQGVKELGESVELAEDQHSADYKVSSTGHKYRARHIEFANSKMNAEPSRPEEDDEKESKPKKHKPMIKTLPEASMGSLMAAGKIRQDREDSARRSKEGAAALKAQQSISLKKAQDRDAAWWKAQDDAAKAGKTEFEFDGKKHPIKSVKEEFDNEHEELELSDAELEKMVNTVDTEDEIIDAYDEDELCIVDQDTGEVVDQVKEEVEQINEVLSRVERMRAKIRFARTASKRERRLQIALKTRSSAAKINKRARTLAVKLMKQRLVKKPLAQMTTSEKERAEAIIARRKAVINRLAMKLAPRIRKIENARLSHSKVTK